MIYEFFAWLTLSPLPTQILLSAGSHSDLLSGVKEAHFQTSPLMETNPLDNYRPVLPTSVVCAQAHEQYSSHMPWKQASELLQLDFPKQSPA